MLATAATWRRLVEFDPGRVDERWPDPAGVTIEAEGLIVLIANSQKQPSGAIAKMERHRVLAELVPLQPGLEGHFASARQNVRGQFHVTVLAVELQHAIGFGGARPVPGRSGWGWSLDSRTSRRGAAVGVAAGGDRPRSGVTGVHSGSVSTQSNRCSRSPLGWKPRRKAESWPSVANRSARSPGEMVKAYSPASLARMLRSGWPGW